MTENEDQLRAMVKIEVRYFLSGLTERVERLEAEPRPTTEARVTALEKVDEDHEPPELRRYFDR